MSQGVGSARLQVPKNGYLKSLSKWGRQMPSDTFRSGACVATFRFIFGTRFRVPFPGPDAGPLHAPFVFWPVDGNEAHQAGLSLFPPLVLSHSNVSALASVDHS